ncbi:MAG: MATE family efflux transporter, partial [Bacteroidales bacterium]|nr:MATE family efflux transporter [Bacteroidales bacterium]
MAKDRKLVKTDVLVAAWADIREAIAGTEKDFTSLPMGKALFLLALPMVLEMAMESVFAIADIFFVSSIGMGAVAIVGITESLMTVVYAIAGGLAIGTTALVARRIGEKRTEEAGKVAVHAVGLAVVVSIAIGIPGFVYAEHILRIMGASSSAINNGGSYTSLMLGANVVISLLFVLNAVFRGAGNAAIAMRILLFANLFNIILDPCLIYGWGPFPEMGVKGAAVATITGRGMAVILQFVYLFANKSRVLIVFSKLRYEGEILLGIIKLSAGGIAQNIIATSSWIFLVSMITGFGDETIAGYTIA